MSDAIPTDKPAQAAEEAKPSQADETRELKTYEDALAFINAAIQTGADAKILNPLQTFFKNRIERTPKNSTEPSDEEVVKRAQTAKRIWKPYAPKASTEAAPTELKI